MNEGIRKYLIASVFLIPFLINIMFLNTYMIQLTNHTVWYYAFIAVNFTVGRVSKRETTKNLSRPNMTQLDHLLSHLKYRSSSMNGLRVMINNDIQLLHVKNSS